MIPMIDDRTEWLKTLKPGDKVVIKHYSDYRIVTIEKITPTGRIVTSDKSRWDERGFATGQSWPTHHLVPITPAILDNIARKRYITVITTYSNLEKLSTESLKAIHDIIKGKAGEVVGKTN